MTEKKGVVFLIGLKDKIRLPKKTNYQEQDDANRMLALMVLKTGSIASAANELGISSSAAYQRARTPGYRLCYHELLQDVTKAVVCDLTTGLSSCLDILGELSESENEWVRLSAVRTWIDTCLKIRALDRTDAAIIKDANTDVIAEKAALNMMEKWGEIEYEDTDDCRQDVDGTESGGDEYSED